MGMTAANKAAFIAINVRRVLAVELLCACQGIDLRESLDPGDGLRPVYDLVREKVPFAPHDRAFSEDIEAVDALISTDALLDAAEAVIGALN